MKIAKQPSGRNIKRIKMKYKCVIVKITFSLGVRSKDTAHVSSISVVTALSYLVAYQEKTAVKVIIK